MTNEPTVDFLSLGRRALMLRTEIASRLAPQYAAARDEAWRRMAELGAELVAQAHALLVSDLSGADTRPRAAWNADDLRDLGRIGSLIGAEIYARVRQQTEEELRRQDDGAT